MAMLTGATVDTFRDNIFNFPTLVEAYRVAAIDIARQRKNDRSDADEGPIGSRSAA
jgi:NAD(P) transhydrogenase